ncbi:MAG: tRNA lysidine(34) synthetase TilS [Thainema sp.]
MSAPWTIFHARIHQTLRSRQILSTGQQLVIAVSGGQDSLCLAQLLIDVQPKWNWSLAIAHCDHRWRPDSTANAAHVQQLAAQWQLPYYQRVAHAPLPSEAAARQWRYQMLDEIAAELNAPVIVTGHTATDRAETLLYNLMRGSGMDGLSALTWKRPLDWVNSQDSSRWLVRPLLEITRQETAQFCRDRNLPIWHDTTNQDTRYTRNRIRLDLLPELAAQFNPQIETTLAQTAELLRADVDYLEAQAFELWQQAQNPANSPAHPAELTLYRLPYCPLYRPVLQDAPLALQRRVMRRFLQQIMTTAPTFAHVEKAVALIQAPNRSCTDPFPGGAIATVQQDWIVIQSVQ